MKNVQLNKVTFPPLLKSKGVISAFDVKSYSENKSQTFIKKDFYSLVNLVEN